MKKYLFARHAIRFVTGDVVAEHTVIGMSFSDSYALLDGINDAGLTGGLLFLDEGTAETRTKYPILRGNEGASVASQSLNAEEAPAEAPAAAPSSGITNTVLIGMVCVLGLAVVVLLIKLGKKENAAK